MSGIAPVRNLKAGEETKAALPIPAVFTNERLV
jgi:hypothetical protein